MLLVCAVSVCAVIGALFALNIVYERNTAVDVARRAASNLAESLARQASDAFSATDCALFGLADRIEGEAGSPAGRDHLQKWMAMQVRMAPRMHRLLVVDERGRVVISNASARGDSENHLREVSYFRAHPNAGVQINLTHSADGWVILVSRSIPRADGSSAGAVIAEIEIAYFEQIYQSVDVGRLGIVGLNADDGITVVRRPQAFIGQRRVALFGGFPASANAGTYTGLGFEGVRRLFAFRRLDGYPLVITVGVAEDEYLAGWRAAALANTVALALVVVMVGALAAGLGLQIRRRKRAEDTLRRLALLDGLTGLANRRQFDAVLEREWKRAQREAGTLGMLMIDVDHFKAYNDRHGHLHGDDVLGAIARTLAASVVRGGDLAARYGGEEFAVILPATNTAGALAIAERIREAVVALALPHPDGVDAVATVSIGVAVIEPTPHESPPVLVRLADSALYDAKRGGRNRTVVLPHATEIRTPVID